MAVQYEFLHTTTLHTSWTTPPHCVILLDKPYQSKSSKLNLYKSPTCIFLKFGQRSFTGVCLSGCYDFKGGDPAWVSTARCSHFFSPSHEQRLVAMATPGIPGICRGHRCKWHDFQHAMWRGDVVGAGLVHFGQGQLKLDLNYIYPKFKISTSSLIMF